MCLLRKATRGTVLVSERKYVRQFKVEAGPHSFPGHTQWALEGYDLSKTECQFVRGIITDNYMDSESYKLRQPTGAFLQGYQEPMTDAELDGWILIEFWSPERFAIDTFVEYLNRKLKEEFHG